MQELFLRVEGWEAEVGLSLETTARTSRSRQIEYIFSCVILYRLAKYMQVFREEREMGLTGPLVEGRFSWIKVHENKLLGIERLGLLMPRNLGAGSTEICAFSFSSMSSRAEILSVGLDF